MINVLVAGSQATQFIFDDSVNMYFHNENLDITTFSGQFFIENYQKLIELIGANDIDILVFDLLFDVVKSKFKNENFENQLKKFFSDLFTVKKGLKIIYNSPRYVNRVIVDENWNDKSHAGTEFLDLKIQANRNKDLDQLEEYIVNHFDNVDLMYFDKNCSALEFNKKKGFADLYFNQAYYLYQSIQFEKISKKFFREFPLYIKFNCFDEIERYFEHSDNKLKDPNTIILLENVDGAALAYQTTSGKKQIILRKLLQMDYIIDGSFGKTKRLIHRSNFYRSNMKKLHNIWYTEEINKKRLSGSNKPKRILFYFTPMSAPKWATDNFAEQALPDRFKSLSRSLVKDTLLIRIADVNLTRGSYFMSSVNYPEYEKNIVNFIYAKIKEYNVLKENVVFYGFSRGGLGSLYYGKLLDFQVVSIDPVVDASYFLNNKNDPHFLEGTRKISFVDELNSLDDSKQKYSKIVLSNSGTVNQIFENSVEPLNEGSTLKKINLEDTNIRWHGQLANQTVPESLTLINQLLDSRFKLN